MGPPIIGACDGVWALWRAGHDLTIHTCRVQNEAQAAHVEAWLAYFGFPRVPVIVPKPIADVYVDDHALVFVTWEDLRRALAGRPCGR